MRRVLCLIPFLFLAGCMGSLPEGKKIDYKSAGKAPTLEVPPDLTQISSDNRFTVPDAAAGQGSATFSTYNAERGTSTVAQNSSILPDAGNIRIERSGNQRWLVVDKPASQLWDFVRDFWQELGFIITTEVREAGIMETDWAENRAKIPDDIIRNTLGKLLDSLYSTGERDKFRTRFEPGEKPGTTDIFISNRRMEEVYTSTAQADTRWQPAPPDPEMEAEMLRRLMVRLGVDERRAEAALINAKTEERAALIPSADGASIDALEISERFDRAWRRLGLALDRIGFTVEDRDRSQGLYFVRYADMEADSNKEGWFSKLFSWGKDSKKEQPQYRIQLKETAGKTVVRVLSEKGEEDRSNAAKKILNLLFGQLR